MKVALVLAALLGFGTAGAVAPIAPGDPSGNHQKPSQPGPNALSLLHQRRGRLLRGLDPATS
jgi:hypothetical protein